jgi:hypothetical protein
MKEMVRFMRKVAIRWQLRSLDEQAANIMEARNQALLRLMQIQRERDEKAFELQQHNSRQHISPAAASEGNLRR